MRSWLLCRESRLITHPHMCARLGVGDSQFLGEAHVKLREVK